MIRSYLTSVWRYISRNKGFTFINVLGVVIGMTAFMLIGQYVLHELTYDDFWENKDRVYRVQLDRYNKGVLSTQWAAGCAGIGPDLKSNFSEVGAYTRLYQSRAVLSHGDVFFREDGVYYASRDFFKVFGYHLAEGTDSLALKEPNQMVLSRSLAKKYFGAENPLGKTLRNNGQTEYVVTGIFEDLPVNTHMKIDALLSFQTFAKRIGRNDDSELLEWQWDGFLTYILLGPNVSARAFEGKLPAFVDKKIGEELRSDGEAGMVFHLQRLADIHLDSNYIGEFKPNGSRETTYFLSVIAALVLLIAWINYINLSTAKSIDRAREVGVRKVMGSFRRQLVQQFLMESLMINVAAVVASVLLVWALTPWFSEFTGRDMHFTLLLQPLFWLVMGGVILTGALLSGLYPAFVLSSFKPVEVLKGKFKNTNQGVLFRKGMVVVQFVASITLIVGTYAVHQQIAFMRSGDLGIDVEQTVVIRPPNVTDSTYRTKFDVFKQRLHQYPEVINMTATTSVPGESPDWNAGGIRRLSQREEESNQYRIIMTDHDYAPLFGLTSVAGRLFKDSPEEGRSVVLNETAARQLGFTKWEDAVNDQIFFWGDTFRIVGVMKNYRQESLKEDFEPLIFRYGKGQGFFAIKFNTADVPGSLVKFETDWKEFFPGNPFDFFFLDEFYDRQYKADQQFGKSFGLFSGLAIFIAAMGLFGLSSLTAIQRTKEIGVRKVLGASAPGIVMMVSRDYVALLGLAIVVAVPVSWWVMNSWLSGFANRITLSWWIFAAPSLLVVAIALFTVSIHTLRAARTNPATSLRYE